MREPPPPPGFVRALDEVCVLSIKTLGRRADPPAFLVALWPDLATAEPLALNDHAGARAARFAPGEWIAWGPAEILRPLVGHDQRDGAYVFDLTAGRRAFALTGEPVWSALRALSPLFLHDPLAPGRCALTRLGEATVLLARSTGDDAIELIVETSLAPYLLDLLGRPV